MGELEPIYLAILLISFIVVSEYHRFKRKEFETRMIEALERIATAVEKRQ